MPNIILILSLGGAMATMGSWEDPPLGMGVWGYERERVEDSIKQ